MMSNINKIFEERYEYLLECATNCLKLRNRTDLAEDLVTSAFLYFTKIQSTPKFKEKIKHYNLESQIVQWMKKQIIWNNTQFKQEHMSNNYNLVSINNDDYDLILEDEDVKSEEEYLKEEQIINDKLASIGEFIKKQPLDQQLLFRDYFINGYNSSGKISQKTGIPRTGCWLMIKKLKENIRNNYKDNIV